MLCRKLHGCLRDECINEHPFRSNRHARDIIKNWRIDHYLNRAHTSLDGPKLHKFATKPNEDYIVKRANL